MKKSLQEVLLSIPLSQLSFLTPLPKKPIYYETIAEKVSDRWFENPTLLVIENEGNCKKLNEKGIATRLIQDSNLIGLVLCFQCKSYLEDEVISLFRECQIPILSISDSSSIKRFHQSNRFPYSYSQISMELTGALEKGFAKIATELAKGLDISILYLDEKYQPLWQTGTEEEVREANRWLNAHRKVLVNAEYINSGFSTTDQSTMGTDSLYELYGINVAGVINQWVLASSQLVDWQKGMVDKLVGLTALLIQTEEMFLKEQDQLKEHFVYDLLYHKFESQKVMVKQGKSWGWNLERPHHLFVIDIKVSEEEMTNDWLNEIVLFIENQSFEMEEKMIVFPFQDQIVVLLEDGSSRTAGERKKHVIKNSNQLAKGLSTLWPLRNFSFGIGKWYQDTTFLNKSYQEAKIALQFGEKWFVGKNVYHINDLGILRLLIQIHQEILLDFSNEYLLSLVESDRENGTEYVKTLQIYIRHQAKINEVSEEMYIHPNTLRNRLKKIEELTGIDLQDPDEIMNLIISVKILSLLKL